VNEPSLAVTLWQEDQVELWVETPNGLSAGTTLPAADGHSSSVNCRQLIIRAHNETLPIAAVRVGNPGWNQLISHR
jgi:hypothetical protein